MSEAQFTFPAFSLVANYDFRELKNVEDHLHRDGRGSDAGHLLPAPGVPEVCPPHGSQPREEGYLRRWQVSGVFDLETRDYPLM